MRTLVATIQYIWTVYMVEYPSEQVSQEMPSSALDAHAANNAQHTTEIRATSRIENERECQLRVAAWAQA